MGGVGVEGEVSDLCIAIAPLEGAEDALDGGPDGSDQLVSPGLPARQLGMVLVGPVHDPVLDARRLEARSAGVSVVGHIGIDRARVVGDQFVGRLGVVDRGGRQPVAPDQARALVPSKSSSTIEIT